MDKDKSIWEIRQQKDEEKRNKYKKLASRIKTDRIEFITNTILKEVRQEHRLVLQILYALFSIYTPNPINLAVNAPSGEGKTYAVKNVDKYFEVGDDIQHLGGMTEKSLFHRKGDVVIREDDDTYVHIDIYLDPITEELEDITEKLKEAEAKDKTVLRERRRNLIDMLKKYEAEAIKRIDLRHKALIFQDTPDPRILENMMPLLSHDQDRVFYEFVNKNTSNDITTTQNMLEGWPSVIYCQAIDTSDRERWPEILRRFIICNPEMTKEKYIEAIDQIFKGSLTENRYEKEVVSQQDIDTTKGLVLEIIDQLKEYFLENTNSVIMPFRGALKSSFKNEGGFDMAVANKTHTLLTLLPFVNLKERPYLLTGEGKKIPFCTFKDLDDSLYINEFVYGGLRQDILKWYISVFYHVWNEKKMVNNTDTVHQKNGEDISESKVVVFINELIYRTQEVYGGERMAESVLRKRYLVPIINHGYVDELKSVTRPNEKVYYPTSHEIVSRYEIVNNELKLKRKLQIYDDKHFPDTRYMFNEIEKEIKEYPDGKFMDIDDEEISIDDIIAKYYPNPSSRFMKSKELDEKEIHDITGSATTSTPPIDYFVNKKEEDYEMVCEKCGETIRAEDKKEHDEWYCRPTKKFMMNNR